MTTAAPYAYRHPIEPRGHIPWTPAQEGTISLEYPLETANETCDMFVARIYLQFLWLPEVIMNLDVVIPSLEAVNVPSTSSNDAVHSMHSFLEPLLLSAATITAKYQTELPQILLNGGGAGEMEEAMMWYAISHEKGNGFTLNPGEDDIWMNEKWRSAYLDRMERREVMIQILLYFFKFSLPGPPPPSEPPTKRKRSKNPPPPTLEDDLETLMDRLSVWQLMGNLDHVPQHATGNKDDTRDWMQQFAEDIVEKHFLRKLPELCSLLRSKVFPSSPFSDDDFDIPTEHTVSSPRLAAAPKGKKTARNGTSTNNHDARTLERARSRSLSVSLAQEEEERAKGMHRVPSKKRVLNREVSMNRGFKARPAIPEASKIKASQEATQPPVNQRSKKPDLGVTLVEETPATDRTLPVTAGVPKPPQPIFGAASIISAGSSLKRAVEDVDDDDDEMWMVDSSPVIHTIQTPTRQKRSKRSASLDDDEGSGMTVGGKGKETGKGKKSSQHPPSPSRARVGRKKKT